MYSPSENYVEHKDDQYVDHLHLKKGQIDKIQEALEYSKTHICPNCGYCPCCGRRTPYSQPYYPPYYPYPFYSQPEEDPYRITSTWVSPCSVYHPTTGNIN